MGVIMTKQHKLLSYFINLSFYLYFLILLIERILSVSLSISNGVNIYSSGYYGYVYTLVFFSILAWLIYLLIRCRSSIKALFSMKEEILTNIPFKDLCISSGLLLLSGMVHTEYTYSVIQFISYGILIIGILLKVIMINSNSDNRTILWLSFIYLVCFSMAIPVMYHSSIELHVLFHVLEGITSFLLVGLFTYLLLLIFNNKDDLFIYIPIIIAVVLDTILIALRWNEEINYFVLIFIALSLFVFIAGKVVKAIKKTNK